MAGNRGSRRSLSEVIGALVVLTVVIIATLSMIRLSQEVVSYAQRVSSRDFVKSSQEATPPTMSVIVRNSTLYMMVSYPVPINISYAVLNVSGKLIVERLNELVSGEALIPLLSNYSCQNVSIELVSSSGAAFRYVPFEDPLLQGRVRPGVYYFSCSLLTEGQAPGGSAGYSQAYYSGPYLGPDAVPISTKGVYLVGMNYGNGTLDKLGALKVIVNASGWYSSGIKVTVYINGSKFEGLVSEGSPTAYLGSVNLSGIRLSLVAFVVGGSQPYFGLSLEGPSVLVSFNGSSSLSGVAWSGFTGPPGVMVPLALGLTGNVTGTAYAVQGSDVVSGSSWYYSFNYNGSSRGWGLTSGPVALATYYDLVPSAYDRMTISATLLLTVWHFSGTAQLTLKLQGPVYMKVMDVSAQGTPLAEAASSATPYAAEFATSIVTAYGNATEWLGTQGLLVLAPSTEITLMAPEPVEVAQDVSLVVNLTNYVVNGLTASKAALWAKALADPQPTPIVYAVELNVSGSAYIVVPPSAELRDAYVNGEYQQGPVLVAIGAPQVSGLQEPIYVAPVYVSGISLNLGEWYQLNQTLPAGAYALWADGLYWLVVSGPS